MWTSRIVGEGEERASDLLANPYNYREHSPAQRKALNTVLGNIGWVQRVMVNKRTGYVVDGHCRIEQAIANGDQMVPVVYVDLSEEEERQVLATLDPIAAMAQESRETLEQVVSELGEVGPDMVGLIAELHDLSAEDVSTEPAAHKEKTCPHCGGVL